MEDLRLEGKSLSAEELQSGDLEVTGYAVIYDGLDRTQENFLPGSLSGAIKQFLTTAPSLNFHHKRDKVIGRVLALEETDKGVFMRARVDRQSESSPLRWIYDAIKRGTIDGLSVSGKFRRRGGMIDRVEYLSEISLTSIPAHPLTTGIQVNEVKSLDPERQLLHYQVNRVNREIDQLRWDTTMDRWDEVVRRSNRL